MAETNGKKTRVPREARLVADYLATKYPTSILDQFVRLGAVLPNIDTTGLSPGEVEVLRNFTRMADAVVYRDNEIIIIEGYVLPSLGKVSQLLTYMKLFPVTPGMERHKDKKLTGVIVGAIEDPVLTHLANSYGLTFELFRPDWITEYLNDLAARFPSKLRGGRASVLGTEPV